MRYAAGLLLLAAVCGCGTESEVTEPVATKTAAAAAEASYTIVKFSASLGGTLSRGMAINRRGLVAGWSDQADGSRRAVLWRNGAIRSLGTLGGPSSTVPWPGVNNHAMVVGISQTNRVDPLDEAWSCELGGFLLETTNLICRGFVWSQGRMRSLRPLPGGHHSFAAGVNNRGQIVGWAENGVRDPTCVDDQVLRFRAALWELKDGIGGAIRLRQLRPYGEHTTSAATAINNKGVAVGISGDCDQGVGRFSALEAVRWDENGKPSVIPNLGGTTWHTPMDINESGDVVGFSNPPGSGDPEGEFIAHAFYWAGGAGTATDIGTLDDDPLSEAFAINAHRQVVGISFGGAAGARAFLWHQGQLTDLNDLVETDDVLLSAQDINDDGQITGRLRDAVTGQTLAFVATPSSDTP
jgi:probable HAF family extracellular repeat protein